jgi:pimeloyl-ACP methyl ester carboxylesterase
LSSITTDQGILHYEVYGRGRPVILLHGWLGSWGLWQETMTFLGRYYRTYALDFWGFGDSGKKRETYRVQDFISLVDQFMDKMGIAQAPLVGHSMGGTVSLSVALQFPQRTSKVVVVGSPINGSSLAFPLKLAGIPWIAWLIYNLFPTFRSIMRVYSRFICSDPRFPDMMDRDLSKTTLQSFLISISTLRRTDLRADLHRIKIPVMGMYGDRDIIVHPRQWDPLQKGLPQAKVERYKKAGHFIMLDDPQVFQQTLKEFLDTDMLNDNEHTQ